MDVLMIANPDTGMSRPIRELTAEVLSAVAITRAPEATKSLLSIDKAPPGDGPLVPAQLA